MNNLKGFNKLNRTHSHRRALYRNMIEALFKNERIKTTKVKAKEIRRVAEKIITKARVKSLHNIRIIMKLLKDKAIVKKLFDEIAPRYIERNGGYTRIITLSKRKGDGAEMAYLELIEEQSPAKKKRRRKKKSSEENKIQQDKTVDKVKEDQKVEVKEDDIKDEKIKDEAKENTTTIIEEEKQDDSKKQEE